MYIKCVYNIDNVDSCIGMHRSALLSLTVFWMIPWVQIFFYRIFLKKPKIFTCLSRYVCGHLFYIYIYMYITYNINVIYLYIANA